MNAVPRSDTKRSGAPNLSSKPSSFASVNLALASRTTYNCTNLVKLQIAASIYLFLRVEVIKGPSGRRVIPQTVVYSAEWDAILRFVCLPWPWTLYIRRRTLCVYAHSFSCSENINTSRILASVRSTPKWLERSWFLITTALRMTRGTTYNSLLFCVISCLDNNPFFST